MDYIVVFKSDRSEKIKGVDNVSFACGVVQFYQQVTDPTTQIISEQLVAAFPNDFVFSVKPAN